MLVIGAEMVEKRPKGVGREQHNHAAKVAFYDVAAFWWRQFVKFHFTRQARGRYKYKRRTKKYLEKKKRMAARGEAKLGGVVDIVLSGTVQSDVTRFRRITATSKGSTCIMRGPNYLFMRPKKATHPNLGAEVTRITRGEENELTRVIDESYTAALNTETETEKTTIR